jgi:hypothetical protein
MNLPFNREPHSDWDFLGANTRIGTHCFHDYPAKMIPQVAGRLIEMYGKKGGLLFDPYCGTGTSLVEGRINGMNCAGTDLNPLARKIAEAKTTIYQLSELGNTYLDLLDEIQAHIFEVNNIEDLNIPDTVTWEQLLAWWPKRAIKEMLIAIEHINKIQSEKLKLFYLIALSECLRIVSFQRNGEFKKYRIAEDKRDGFYTPLLEEFSRRIVRNIRGVREYSGKFVADTTIDVHQFNTVQTLPYQVLGKKIDLVVTSPPYGDSGTTVAYGQYSWFSNVLFGFTGQPVDKHLMGGSKSHLESFGFSPIDEAIQAINDSHETRSQEVMNFYVEYYDSIKNTAKSVNKGGYVCYVVGNRNVKNIQLPTDQFTAWAFAEHGFEFEKIFLRNIPNKRMPSKNSPSNVPGAKSPTMTNEFMVVLKKSE